MFKISKVIYFYRKKLLFDFSKSKIYKYQNKISTFNNLKRVIETLVSICHNKIILSHQH